MGKYIGPKEKLSRRLGVNLGLKPERSFGPKSAFLRRAYPPGIHGQGRRRRRSVSDFSLHLSEKQKVRFSYGISERQLSRYFTEAKKSKGATGERLFELLERRLDNSVYRLGLAPSRSVGRQLVSHGHFQVNGKRVKTPSYSVSKGDVVSIRPNSQAIGQFKELAQRLKNYKPPSWLSIDKEKFEGKVTAAPAPDEAGAPFDMQLVIEYYSR